MAVLSNGSGLNEFIWDVERDFTVEVRESGFVFILLNNKCLLPDDYLVGLFHSVYKFLFVNAIQEHSEINVLSFLDTD